MISVTREAISEAPEERTCVDYDEQAVILRDRIESKESLAMELGAVERVAEEARVKKDVS